MAKLERVIAELVAELERGLYGRPGDPFITVRELARQKGISHKTAFSAVNTLKESGAIAKRGRSHVVGATPPRAAGEQPHLLGCVVTTLESPYFATLARRLEEAAHQLDASLMLASSEYDFSREKDRINAFLALGAAGLFICPWADEEQEDFYRALPVPFVIIGRALKRTPAPTVVVNNQSAAQKVAAHLVKAGCDAFAYVGQAGSKRDERLFGYRSELLERGCKLPEKNIVRTDYADHDACLAAIDALLSRAPAKRLGIFCYHDLFAARVLLLCHKRGIDVPGRVLIAGFDDLPLAEVLTPPLTSVRYPVEAMAGLAAEALYAQLQRRGGHGNACSYVNAELVIRQSTRP